MSSGRDALADRRRDLVARCERQRTELATLFGRLERKYAAADAIVATARRWQRDRFLVPAAAVLLILAPAVARGWIRRAIWLAPLALHAFRLAKAPREAGRPSPTVAPES